MPQKLNLIGQKFGKLIVLKEVEKEHRKRKLITWECLCECGNTCLATTQDLRIGDTKSCGCLVTDYPERHITNHTHGYSKHPLYKTWDKVLRRCYDKTGQDYYLYGARGIGVCDEWRVSPGLFCEWGMKNGYKKGLTLDRINNDMGYSPDNCRWVDMMIQNRNKRSNINITINNKTQCLKDWCKEIGLNYSTIKRRKKYKNDYEQFLVLNMIKKHIVIINGGSAVGKDEFCHQCNMFVPCKSISTVDKIKEAYILLGWQGNKTERHRKALSDMKDIATECLDHPYNYISCEIEKFKISNEKILFIHSREPEEIARFVNDFGCITVLIRNPNVKIVTTNHADANVELYQYDYTVDNDGTLDDLKFLAKTFVEWLKEGEI